METAVSPCSWIIAETLVSIVPTVLSVHLIETTSPVVARCAMHGLLTPGLIALASEIASASTQAGAESSTSATPRKRGECGGSTHN